MNRAGPNRSVIAALWRRDLWRLARERSRWLGVVLQPALFWWILGKGLSDHFWMPGEGMSYRTWFYPGVLVMIVLFTTIFATLSVIEDRQSGFLPAVLVAPGSPGALVAGKIAGVTTMAFLQSSLFLLLAPVAGYPFARISWPALLLTLGLGSGALTALNFAMAWVLNSAQAYHAIMSVVLLPLWLLSGSMFPRPPSAFGRWMWANPMTYFSDAMHRSLRGDALRGLGFWLDAAALAAMGLVTTALAVRLVSRRPGGSRIR